MKGKSKQEISLNDEDKQRNSVIVVERVLTYYINKVGYCYRCCCYNRTHASSEILMVILKCCLKSWHRAKRIVV